MAGSVWWGGLRPLLIGLGALKVPAHKVIPISISALGKPKRIMLCDATPAPPRPAAAPARGCDQASSSCLSESQSRIRLSEPRKKLSRWMLHLNWIVWLARSKVGMGMKPTTNTPSILGRRQIRALLRSSKASHPRQASKACALEPCKACTSSKPGELRIDFVPPLLGNPEIDQAYDSSSHLSHWTYPS